jgi:proteasome assembly chaperone (PAC2) family protein
VRRLRLRYSLQAEVHVPTIAHVLYIPGILLIGIAVGFVMGARAARNELARANKTRRR